MHFSRGLSIGVLALLLASGVAAQTPPPGDVQAAPPAAGAPAAPPPAAAEATPPAAAPDVTPAAEPDRSGRHEAREAKNRALMDSCRGRERAAHVKGPQRRADIIACVRAKNPRVAAGMVCKDQGRAKNLSGDALKNYVHACRS